ncbi:MAG: hypothetical protein HKN84_04780 [Gammaproteobacteria bacterium]|nr:hypothetical protein [Gammaproteobacteria bacterium]
MLYTGGCREEQFDAAFSEVDHGPIPGVLVARGPHGAPHNVHRAFYTNSHLVTPYVRGFRVDAMDHDDSRNFRTERNSD